MTIKLNALKNTGMLLVWLLIAVLTITARMRGCGYGASPATVLVRDTIRLKADSVVVTRNNIKAIYLKGAARVDTLHDTLLQTLICWREQVRQRLDSSGTSELLVLDTNVSLPIDLRGERFSLALRVSDTCDCIARSIRTVIRTRDTTMLMALKAQPAFNYALGVGVSAGITSQGQFAATLALSFSKVLASF